MSVKIIQCLEPEVFIDSPAEGAKIGVSFLVTGTASCKAFEDGPDERGVGDRDATSSISGVRFWVGDDIQTLQAATPTGSSHTLWATWSCAVNTPCEVRRLSSPLLAPVVLDLWQVQTGKIGM